MIDFRSPHHSKEKKWVNIFSRSQKYLTGLISPCPHFWHKKQTIQKLQQELQHRKTIKHSSHTQALRHKDTETAIQNGRGKHLNELRTTYIVAEQGLLSLQDSLCSDRSRGREKSRELVKYPQCLKTGSYIARSASAWGVLAMEGLCSSTRPTGIQKLINNYSSACLSWFQPGQS